MSLIEDTPHVPDSYFVHPDHPAMILEFPRSKNRPTHFDKLNRDLVQVIHLAHLGSKKIDYIVGTLPRLSDYVETAYNFFNILEYPDLIKNNPGFANIKSI